MMESRIGNLKPISFPDSAAGPESGSRGRHARGAISRSGPPAPPVQTLPLAGARCGHGAPSTLRLPAVRAAGF